MTLRAVLDVASAVVVLWFVLVAIVVVTSGGVVVCGSWQAWSRSGTSLSAMARRTSKIGQSSLPLHLPRALGTSSVGVLTGLVFKKA